MFVIDQKGYGCGRCGEEYYNEEQAKEPAELCCAENEVKS